MFLNPFPNAFGLDIGDLSIKVVQLKNISRRRGKRSYVPIVTRSTKLPRGLIVNGIIEEPEKVRKYVQHLLHDAPPGEKQIRSHWVVASLPDAQSFIKRIDIDKRPADIIEEDIADAARRHIPFGEEDYYIDWQIMNGEGGAGEKTSVLIAAAPKRLADMYTYLLESLGLGVIALELEAIAVARTMITAVKTYQGEARGILNLGATRSSFTVFDRNQIQFSVSLPFSGEMITEAIVKQCRLPYAEAERQKLTIGLEYTKSQEACWSSITKMTDILAQEIQKMIHFYSTHFSDTNPITHITMCGGGSLMKRLDRILSTKLRLTARPGNAWKNLTPNQAGATEEGLRYAVAIGVAIRASANPFFLKDAI